jgi:hypothetical protein
MVYPMEELLKSAKEATIVRPGDTIVMAFKQRLTAQQVDDLRASLRPGLPESIAVVIIDDLDGQLLVARGSQP